MPESAAKTVVVTGATGFIGRRLIAALGKESDISLVLLSRKVPEKTSGRIRWLNMGLEQISSSTWSQAGVESIDTVFHLAGYIPKTQKDANDVDQAIKTNALGTQRLIESLPEKTESFIYASTVDIYGAAKGIITENTPVDPVNLYATSKLFGEQITQVLTYGAGIRSVILRVGHIYGPGEEAYQKLIPLVIKRVLAGQSPIIFGDGAELRDFLYVDDVVKALIQAASLSEKQVGPINIVSGESISVFEVIKEIIDATGYQGPIERRDVTHKQKSIRFDNTLMRKRLGNWPLVDFKQGIKAEIAYFESLDNCLE